MLKQELVVRNDDTGGFARTELFPFVVQDIAVRGELHVGALLDLAATLVDSEVAVRIAAGSGLFDAERLGADTRTADENSILAGINDLEIFLLGFCKKGRGT